MIIIRGSCRDTAKAPINPTAGKPMMKLQHIRIIPKKVRAVGFSLNALRSALSLIARLANFVLAMPLANFWIMVNNENLQEPWYQSVLKQQIG